MLAIKRWSQCTKYYIVRVLYAKVIKVQSFTSGCITTIDGKDKCIAYITIQSFRDKMITPFGQSIGDNKVPCVANPLVETRGKVDMVFATFKTCVIDLKTKRERDISDATKL